MIELGKKWLSRNIRMEAKISRCVVRALKYNFVNSMLAFVTIFYLFILLSDESKLQQRGPHTPRPFKSHVKKRACVRLFPNSNKTAS